MSADSAAPSSEGVFNGSADCWHCSLVSYEVSYLSAENMHHFAGYILPGVIFAILGIRYALAISCAI